MKQRWYTLEKHSHFGLRAMCVIGALWLAGCASNPSAPVEERSLGENAASAAHTPRNLPSQTAAIGGSYRVVRGDTLYAIAFKHGVDFRDLAAWNHVVPPYRIYADQELRLSALGNAVASAAPERATASTQRSLPASPPNPPVENVAPVPQAPAPTVGFQPVEDATPPPAPTATVQAAPTPPPVPAPAPAPAKPAAAPVVASETAPKPAESAAQLNAGGVSWRWPGNGKVVGTYVGGDQTRQGIDIAGKAGDSVQAAADGDVVYSGNGLLGYGELIIVKHNASFLSAYGHNRRRLVQEGDKVHAGQQIAEMGSSASSREELHFEIRKNGKPVNPLDYLPVR